jgi:hypothetical protein
MQTQITAPDELEKDIIQEFHNKLDGIPQLNKQKKEGLTDKEWTRGVKNAVGGVLKGRCYKVYASNCEQKDNGEWLYDLIGIEEENGYLKSISLILESEWKSRGRWRDTEEGYQVKILYDFRKLLVSRADHRVMVLEAKSKEGGNKVIKQLLQHVQNCRHSTAGDRYLFACWREVEKKWVFDCSVYVVNG